MNVKKLIATILLTSMTLSLVACSSSSDTSSSSSETSSSSSSSSSSSASTEAETTTTEDTNPWGLKGDGLYSCSDEPLTLTAFIHWHDTYVLTDDMPIPTEMAAFTNITLDGVAPEYSSDSQQAFNLLMTDAVLPDLIGGNIVDINKYGAEGAFIPLNDLLEEYAPNIMATFEKYPDAEAAVTLEDGTIYCVPFVYDEVVNQAWFIRQDWLDNLGLEIPTTFEEFEAVLYAFRDDDPNGNGEADEVPFFMRKSGDTNRLTSILQVFGINAFWHVNDDGQVQIGTYLDDYKDAIKGVAEWYSEGLIDQEIFLRDSSARDFFYSDDNGGVTFDWLPSTSAYNLSIPEYVEDFLIVAMAPPADVNGDVWTAYARQRTEDVGWGISCDNEHVVESIKFMDFLFSSKGQDVTIYGIEGETFYYDENGEGVFYPEMFEGDNSLLVRIYGLGGSLKSMAFFQHEGLNLQVMDDEGRKGTEMYSDYVNVYLPQIPSLSFTLEESDIISSIYPTCEAYMLEKSESWTYDGSRVDAEFDQYMTDLAAMGMDQVVEVYQAAYDRMMASIA